MTLRYLDGITGRTHGPIGRAAGITTLAVLPLLLTVAGFAVGPTAWDFHHELYPQAKAMLEGRNPYPHGQFEPLVGNNEVWPPAAAALVAPFTLLPVAVADFIVALLGLGCVLLAIWLVGVRDWRVFGVTTLWPPVLIEPRLSHLTPVVMLLAAIAWRNTSARYAGGLSVGAAIALKLFVWPLLVWLAASERRRRTGALVATGVAAVSLTAVLPFTPLRSYLAALRRVSAAYDQDGYTVFGLVVQAGGSESAARALTLGLTAALLWGTWRYRSLTLAIAASLVASPVVWLDYFALAAIPLAIAKPRLSLVWFVPLLTAGAKGAGWEIGDVVDTTRVLVAFGVVLAAAFIGEQLRERPGARSDGEPRVIPRGSREYNAPPESA